MYKSPTLSFDGIIGIKTAAEDFVDFELRNGIRFLKSSKHLFLFSSLNRSLVDILNFESGYLNGVWYLMNQMVEASISTFQ